MPKRRAQESKYTKILPTLEKYVNPDTTRQDMINLIKTKMRENGTTASTVSMADAYIALRQEQTQLNTKLSLVGLRLEALDQLLVDSQEAKAEGWGQYGATPTMLRLVSGDALQVKPDLYTNITDRNDLRQFFLQQKLLVELNPHSRTVSKLNRDRLSAGEEPLPGTKVTARNKVFYIKAGTTEEENVQEYDETFDY